MPQIVNDIEIAERVYNPHMDLYAVFGRAVNADPEPFVLAWQKRGKKKLRNMERFIDEKSARGIFQEAALGDITPEDPIFQKDDQKDILYAWEDMHVHPFAKEIDRHEAFDLLVKVCRDNNIKVPELIFSNEDEGNEYFGDTHTIKLKDMDNMTLLHEIAHAIVSENCKTTDREHVAHAPQFVWTVLDLYHDYMDMSMQYMVASASQKGLLGDFSAPQFIPAQKAFPDNP